MKQTGLIHYLTQFATLAKHHGRSHSMESWVLRHGFPMEPAKEPAVKRMAPRQCFRNASNFTLADASGRWVYCEGFASGVIPTLHAWLLDLATGEIHDPTWTDQAKCAYYGVPFRTAFLIESLNTAKMYSLIDQYTLGWPLLRGKHAKKKWINRRAVNLLKTA